MRQPDTKRRKHPLNDDQFISNLFEFYFNTGEILLQCFIIIL